MGAYSYKQNAQEIFENFFGTKNPFATFGFEAMPFASKLNKPGPVKGKPVVFNLECSLKGQVLLLFEVIFDKFLSTYFLLLYRIIQRVL